jgi:hypothetical protein
MMIIQISPNSQNFKNVWKPTVNFRALGIFSIFFYFGRLGNIRIKNKEYYIFCNIPYFLILQIL